MSSFFMRHFGFQPTLWPTLFTVPALVVILALGFWQLQRLQEKLAVIEAFEARVTAPAVAPPPAGAPVAEIEFQPVSATGRYHADKEVLILDSGEIRSASAPAGPLGAAARQRHG